MKDSFFSVSLRKDQDGLRSFIHCVSYDALREICVLWDRESTGLCDVMITSLSPYRQYRCGIVVQLYLMW